MKKTVSVIALVLMLASILVYVLTLDESEQPLDMPAADTVAPAEAPAP